MPPQTQADPSVQTPIPAPSLVSDASTDNTPSVPLDGLRTRLVKPAPNATGGIDLTGLRTRTIQQAQSELPRPTLVKPWEQEPELESAPTTKLGQAYADAKAWLSKHEQHLSDEYLAPFRRGLDKMADDIEGSPYVKASGPTAKGFAYGTAELLRQTPIRENVKETALANINPEFPEAGALSKELQAGEKAAAKAAPNLEGLRTREVSAPKNSPKELPASAEQTPTREALESAAFQAREQAHAEGCTGGKCQEVSYALEDILKKQGHDAWTTFGSFKKQPHSWVRVGDTYIDPTYDQFYGQFHNDEDVIRIGRYGEDPRYQEPSLRKRVAAAEKSSSQTEQPWQKSGKDFDAVYHGGKKTVGVKNPKALAEAAPKKSLADRLFDEALAKLPDTKKTAAKTTVNASGESAASAESLSRMASEKRRGIQRIAIDTRSGKERPLIGPDAVDYRPQDYERVVRRESGKADMTLDEGKRALPPKPPKR